MVFTGILVVFFFWKQSLLLSILLISLAFSRHKIYPLKKELLWFILIGAIGSIGESIVILRGAWSYGQAHLINIPYWLPLLWGLAGTTALTLYQGITDS